MYHKYFSIFALVYFSNVVMIDHNYIAKGRQVTLQSLNLNKRTCIFLICCINKFAQSHYWPKYTTCRVQSFCLVYFCLYLFVYIFLRQWPLNYPVFPLTNSEFNHWSVMRIKYTTNRITLSAHYQYCIIPINCVFRHFQNQK